MNLTFDEYVTQRKLIFVKFHRISNNEFVVTLAPTKTASEKFSNRQDPSNPFTDLSSIALVKLIEIEDRKLTDKYSSKLIVNSDLKRSLVSFQANKKENQHRWFKYKEGFSAALMHYIFENLKIQSGTVFDPFAGAGTTLFVSQQRGLDSIGVELLPNCAEIIKIRSLLSGTERNRLISYVKLFKEKAPWKKPGEIKMFQHIKITSGAFSPENEMALQRYLYEIDILKDKNVTSILQFAALCILESISFTRKDGQYLRWDHRSNRRPTNNSFNKGKILNFDEAIDAKLNEIITDVTDNEDLPENPHHFADLKLLTGSSLDILPKLKLGSFDALITSPPYCNRYDYTRTYALELAMLGIDESKIRDLRQTMLSCTVENREKSDLIDRFDSVLFGEVKKAYDSQRLLQLILQYLKQCSADKTINNPGIPRMVASYFFELALVIAQCRKLLKPNAPFVMVNDNVRYAGVHIPVDLILSDLASDLGYTIEKIWVLPRGKGNSSQQMGVHGRQEIRKCVYVWRVKD